MSAILDIARPYQKVFITSPKRYKIACWSRQVGKSWSLAALLVMKALQHGSSGLSICLSINLRSASEILKKCTQMAEAVKLLSNGMITYTAAFDKIVFSNGARVISLPGTMEGAAVRGWTVNGALVIDEAAYIRGLDTLLQALAPTMTTCPNAELILASTPSGRNHMFYKLWCDALQDDDWFASKVTIKDAVEQGLNVNIEQLHKLCPDPTAFEVEYMAEFAAAQSDFIDETIIDFVDIIPRLSHRWLGVDIGSTHDRSAFCTLGAVGDDFYVEDIEVLKNAEYTHQQTKIISLNEKNKYIHGFIDSNGIGSALAEFVHKTPNCANINGFITTAVNKPQMFELLRSKIFERKLHFSSKLKDKILLEFSKISRIINDAGKTTYTAQRDADGHCDMTSSLLLALQAAKQNPANFVMPMPWAFRSRF